MIIISSFSFVNAEEITEEKKDITNDVEIRYKWYKEVVEGDYYPLKEVQEDYIIDENKIKYGPLSDWNESNCKLPKNYYFIEYDLIKVYRKIENIRFVKLDNFTFNDNVEIYHNNEKIDYKITSQDENSITINLVKEYSAENLTFYITNDQEYKISLYREKYLNKELLSKNVQNEEFLIPDGTWITDDAYYVRYYTTENLRETDLTKLKEYNQICRYQEIYVYKYKINREYYDDNYHLNVDGYIKDINDYKIFYQENPITNIVEITTEKIIKEPKIEYIYIPSENNIKKIDSSEKTKCIPKIETQIKTEVKTIEKEFFKVPKKIYLIILVLILIIIIQTIRLKKKYVD